MIRATVIWAVWVALPVSILGQGTFRVHFDQNSYTTTPGANVNLGIIIDPLPSPGLFSYGLRVVFADAFARVEAASAIEVPPPLDFNGVLGPGADRAIGPGFGAVKGTVDFLLSPPQSYTGSLLATINLKDLAGVGQSYPVSIELYRTLGESESVFVNGAGETLDSRITFGSALITVVPESPGVSLLIAGLVAWRLWPGRGMCCVRNEAWTASRISLN